MRNLSNENIIHVMDGDIQYIQFRRLLEYSDAINHCFTLRDLDFGIRSDVNANIEQVFLSNKLICDELGMDYRNIVKPCQSHTNEVKRVDRKINLNLPDMYLDAYNKTDGIVTNKKDIILATVNADCMLLIFFDPVKKVIANSHSGWRGTFSKIAKNTVNKMIEEYESNPKDIICCMAPSIGKCCFEVHEDVSMPCEELFAYTGRIDEIVEFKNYEDGKPKFTIDTVLISRIILEEAGLKEENIIESKLCSMCNSDKIHSRRNEGKKYRVNTALIELKK